ncbi:MAG: hypothetical protein ACYTEO_12750 [Planctomycetota bacterium]|jgi:hypothetical protein
MRTRNLLAVTAGLICCVVVVLLSPSIQGGEKTYEIRPQVTLPEYRSDAARAIDAYERLIYGSDGEEFNHDGHGPHRRS